MFYMQAKSTEKPCPIVMRVSILGPYLICQPVRFMSIIFRPLNRLILRYVWHESKQEKEQKMTHQEGRVCEL